MAAFLSSENVSVAHGKWGENLAVRYLHRQGYEIRARNVRPCRWDKRLEIDIIAYDRNCQLLIFVEVKQHAARSRYACRLQCIDKHKKELLRKACRAYLAQLHWQAGYRFDVIEIYGTPEDAQSVEIDHISRVQLFARPDTYVNWAE